jgi:hypothetical protein
LWSASEGEGDLRPFLLGCPMPAIQLARLRQQASELATLYKEPVLFSRRLHLLLEQYADHTQRYGQSNEIPSMLLSYNVPYNVLRQFVIEMKASLTSDPEGIIRLVNHLWGENSWEHRKIALNLLGQISQPPQTIKLILSQWLASFPEERIIEEIMRTGTIRFRQEYLSQYLDLAKDWLESPDIYFQKCGLYALIILVDEGTYDNLPLLYKLTSPRIRRIPVELRAPAIRLLVLLARSFPGETAFFLKSNLDAPQNPDTPWLIRKVLPEFPEDLQDNLKRALRMSS